jgi:hypothetical protein
MVCEKDEGRRRKYSVHPYFNKSGETGSVVVTEPDQDRGRF